MWEIENNKAVIIVNDILLQDILQAINTFEGKDCEVKDLSNDYGTGVFDSVQAFEKRDPKKRIYDIDRNSTSVICFEDEFCDIREANEHCLNTYGVNFYIMSFIYPDMFVCS